MRRGTVVDSLSAVLAFAGPLALYAITLSPGVDFWDTGEMQTVPYLLGIAHPTGFPLFVLLGWLFAHAIAIGDVARRLSLFSALASAAAAGLLYVFVRDVTQSRVVGLAAALTFSLGDTVWTRAIRAEVHDLALAFTALALVAAARAGATGSSRALAVAAAACGLGLATHPVVALACPAVLVLAWPALAAAAWRARAAALALAVAPLGAYAYVPLRSAFVEAHGLDPSRSLGVAGGAFFDYGAPATAPAFWAYVTGAAFRPGEAFLSLRERGRRASRARTRADASLPREGRDRTVVRAGRLRLSSRVAAARGRGAGSPRRGRARLRAQFPRRIGWRALCPDRAVGALRLRRSRRGLGRPLGRRPRATRRGARCRDRAARRAMAERRARVRRRRVPAPVRGRTGHGLAVRDHTADGSLIVATWTFATPLAYAAYVERALGARHLLSGWPHDFPGRYPAWRARLQTRVFRGREHVRCFGVRADARPRGTLAIGGIAVKLAVALGAFAFALYLVTLPPSFAFWDTGELQTVAAILGIAHPPACPAFVLLGWLAVHAIPFGEPAWRVDALCAFSVAASVSFLALVARRIGVPPIARAIVALGFACAIVPWRDATRAEVQDLALLFRVAALYFGLRYLDCGARRDLFIAALATGIAGATHGIAILLLPAARDSRVARGAHRDRARDRRSSLRASRSACCRTRTFRYAAPP